MKLYAVTFSILYFSCVTLADATRLNELGFSEKPRSIPSAQTTPIVMIAQDSQCNKDPWKAFPSMDAYLQSLGIQGARVTTSNFPKNIGTCSACGCPRLDGKVYEISVDPKYLSILEAKKFLRI